MKLQFPFYHVLSFTLLISALLANRVEAQIGGANISPKIGLHRLADEYVIEQTMPQYRSLIDSAGEITPLPDTAMSVKTKLEMAMGQSIDLHIVKPSRFIVRTFPNGAVVLSESVVTSLARDEAALAWLIAREASHFRHEHLFRGFRRRVVLDTTLQVALEKKRLDSPLLQLAYDSVKDKYSPDEDAVADMYGFLHAVKAGYDQRKIIESPAVIEKAILGYPLSPENTNRLQEYQKALRNGVPPEWIVQGRMTKEVKDERGTRPEFLAARTTLMDIFLNRSPALYQRNDHRRIGVEAKVDGYLTILYSTPSGEVRSILPNEYDKKGEIRADTLLLVPSAAYLKNKNQPIQYKWEGGGDFYLCFVLTHSPWSTRTIQNKIVPEDLARIVLREIEATKVDVIDLYALQVSIKK